MAPRVLIPYLLLTVACNGKGETGFGRHTQVGTDTGDTSDTGDTGETVDSAETGDSTETSVWDTDPFGGGDTSLDNGGGGDDTVNAAWVRCEDGGQTWTFHMELNYAARAVAVDVAKGTPGYEIWYLQVQDDGRTLWETTVSGLSGHTCDETLDLLWTVTGSTGWSVSYESEYTPA